MLGRKQQLQGKGVHVRRRSEVLAVLETVRDRIEGYDPRTDRSGRAWEELRITLDKGVLTALDMVSSEDSDLARSLGSSEGD